MKLSRVLLSFFFFRPPLLSRSKSRLRISRVFYSNPASSLSPYSRVRNPSSSLPDVSTIYQRSCFRNIYIRRRESDGKKRAADEISPAVTSIVKRADRRCPFSSRLDSPINGDCSFHRSRRWELRDSRCIREKFFWQSKELKSFERKKRESRSIVIANRQ